MARIKKLTDYAYSPTNPASEDAIREEIDDAIQEVYDKAILLEGDQTIDDIKTFTSSPIVPTATTAFQPATKGYVDSLLIVPLDDGSVGDIKLSNAAGQIKSRTQIHNLETDITYKFNYQISATGKPQLVYEEVV